MNAQEKLGTRGINRTPKQVERLIRHAISASETKLCNQTLDQLTPAIREHIDILLTTEETTNSLGPSKRV